jgi:hypothetical protein
MTESVPQRNPLINMARIVRLRAFSATPPSPHDGSPPFDRALPNWLENITPLGADVLHTNLSMIPLTEPHWTNVEPPHTMRTRTSTDGRRIHESRATTQAYRPLRHPTEAERQEQKRREARITEAWSHAHALMLALLELGIGNRGTARGALSQAETALWLAGPDTREPGVPIHGIAARSTRNRLMSRKDSELRGERYGRNGAHVLRIECATSHDLAGATARQLSRAQHWAKDVDGKPGSTSSAQRAIREGRALLHALGAWPWAHVAGGRMHEVASWWTDPQMLEPLRRWLARSWGRFVLDELARHHQGFELEPRDGQTAKPSQFSAGVIEQLGVDIVVALDGMDLQEQPGSPQ